MEHGFMVCLPFLAKGKFMSKSTLKILPVLMVVITAAWVTQPVFGDGSGFHDFVITENSSASLTATYDGSPLTVLQVPGFPDEWTFALPTGFLSTVGLQQWTEPENSNLVNAVSFGTAMTRAGSVQSDFSLNTQFPINADGASVLVGTDGGVDVFASFTDNGDTATVPDTGTTFSLLGLSLMGLGFLRRKILA
jgi:VPDSG-CTERM motif